MAKFCSNCGKELIEGADVCLSCGKTNKGGKSKLVAGLLGLFFGAWGIHNFYLGFSSKAVTQIIVTIVTCGIGSIWGFIEGILILTGDINTDSDGKPLSD